MNRVILLLAATSMWLFVACSNTTETQSAEKADTTMETTSPEETAAAADKNYTIEVLNDSLPSPRKQMTTVLGTADITINYGSPAVKDRGIWGELVPYGSVWRTGANEATSIEFSKDVMIEGQKLAAGTYGLFSIPGETDWTIIFNETSDQWGAYEYKEDQDVLRAKVIPQASEEMAERMDFMVKDDQIILAWEKIMVPITVTEATAE